MIFSHEGFNKGSHSDYCCNYRVLWNYEHVMENVESKLNSLKSIQNLRVK